MAVDCLNYAAGDNWALYHGDCCDVLRQLPERSVDMAIYSPPFCGLYIYSDSAADMGNSATDEEFYEHYRFFVREIYRVIRPGRLVYVHCKDLVYYRNQRGTAGLRDFQGELIRLHVEAGFDFHSRVTVERCPVREMTKTKAHGLLYKQLRADSTFSRQGLPEYILVFRRWAKNDEEESAIIPVMHTHESFPLPQWQEWANPIWRGTRETDCLNSTREANDEKHICPLPLDLVRRCVIMGSNPGEVILDPFNGIGSSGYVALKEGRKYVGVELKESYYKQAIRNLQAAEAQLPLFAAG